MLGAFALATLVAKAFGAGWGTASAFGQIAFAAALVTCCCALTSTLPAP